MWKHGYQHIRYFFPSDSDDSDYQFEVQNVAQ